MSLRLRSRPTRQERAMRIVRVAQTEIPAIYQDTDFSKASEFRDMAMEYQNWLRKNSPGWVPGVPQRGWRAYARDISGDTSRLSFVAGLLLGIAIGVVVALAMTVRPRREATEEEDIVVELLVDEVEEVDDVDDVESDASGFDADGEFEQVEELAEQTATAD